MNKLFGLFPINDLVPLFSQQPLNNVFLRGLDPGIKQCHPWLICSYAFLVVVASCLFIICLLHSLFVLFFRLSECTLFLLKCYAMLATCLLSGFKYCKSIQVEKNVKLPTNATGCSCKGHCVDPKICACAMLNGSDFPYVSRDGGRWEVNSVIASIEFAYFCLGGRTLWALENLRSSSLFDESY